MTTEISQLTLSKFRNIDSCELEFHPKFNLLIGANGSGKSSVLESIYLLGAGRSFRARSAQQYINFDHNSCLVRAKVNEKWLAVQRSQDGAAEYRLADKVCNSAAKLCKHLPVQLLDVNSNQLILGGPEYRRQFIDWGLFHVEHDFLHSWRALQKALKQRNAALRHGMPPGDYWDNVFVEHALEVDRARRSYIKRFQSECVAWVEQNLGCKDLSLLYHSGWDDDLSLTEALQASRNAELAAGHTLIGPQRADLEFRLEGKLAREVVSRGQLKLLVSLLLLARAKLLNEQQASVFLLDDMHAELDSDNCGVLLRELNAMPAQVIIAGIEYKPLQALLSGKEHRMFHVEHGRISNGEI